LPFVRNKGQATYKNKTKTIKQKLIVR